MKKRTIGLLGTSANPLHAGHIEVARWTLRQIPTLDEVWFVVTPLSPHKEKGDYEPVEHRLHLAHLAARGTTLLGKAVKISEFEVHLHRFKVENSTVVMLEHFTDTYEHLQPVWLMGADNLISLHTWGDRWTEIMEKYPVAVVARKGFDDKARQSVAGKRYAHTHRDIREFSCEPGTWCFIEAVDHVASSTNVRADCARGIQSEFITDEAFQYIQDYRLYSM